MQENKTMLKKAEKEVVRHVSVILYILMSDKKQDQSNQHICYSRCHILHASYLFVSGRPEGSRFED